MTSVKENDENTGYSANMKTTGQLSSFLTAGERRDLKVLALFTAVFCRKHHEGGKEALPIDPEVPGIGLGRHRYCPECREFLDDAPGVGHRSCKRNEFDRNELGTLCKCDIHLRRV